jgi:DNA-directed RNA polymerase subunit RPC12/RpoP
METKFSKTRVKGVFEPWWSGGQSKDLYLYSCSQCGTLHDLTWIKAHDGGIPNYCPHCGARIVNTSDEILGQAELLPEGGYN